LEVATILLEEIRAELATALEKNEAMEKKWLEQHETMKHQMEEYKEEQTQSMAQQLEEQRQQMLSMMRDMIQEEQEKAMDTEREIENKMTPCKHKKHNNQRTPIKPLGRHQATEEDTQVYRATYPQQLQYNYNYGQTYQGMSQYNGMPMYSMGHPGMGFSQHYLKNNQAPMSPLRNQVLNQGPLQEGGPAGN
jgi:hypothetical protein